MDQPSTRTLPCKTWEPRDPRNIFEIDRSSRDRAGKSLKLQDPSLLHYLSFSTNYCFSVIFSRPPPGASENSRDPPHFAGSSPYREADILPGRSTGAKNPTTAHPRLTRQRLHCPRTPLPARTIPARLARVRNMVQRRLGPLQP